MAKDKKLELFDRCIVPKLLYGLESLWLLKVERYRLNAFQIRCIRRILAIPPSYISRIPNLEILRRSSRRPLTELLTQRQLILFGRIAKMPDDAPQRRVVFCPGSLDLVSASLRRKRGRPRKEWSNSVLKNALIVSGSLECLQNLLHHENNIDVWKTVVADYIDIFGEIDDLDEAAYLSE